MKYLKSPLLHKIQHSTENTTKITPTIYYQYIFDANNSIKASYSINTLYISFVLFAHMYYKDRPQADTGFLLFQDKNR